MRFFSCVTDLLLESDKHQRLSASCACRTNLCTVVLALKLLEHHKPENVDQNKYFYLLGDFLQCLMSVSVLGPVADTSDLQ